MNKKEKAELLQKKMIEKVDSIIESTKNEIENGHSEIDLKGKNYAVSEICPRGSLLKIKKVSGEFMNINTEMFETISEDVGIAVSHSLVHKENGTHVITFIHEGQLYMHVSKNLLEDFELLIKGTITQDHDPERQTGNE